MHRKALHASYVVYIFIVIHFPCLCHFAAYAHTYKYRRTNSHCDDYANCYTDLPTVTDSQADANAESGRDPARRRTECGSPGVL